MKGEGYKCLIIYQEIKYFYFKAKRNLSIHAIIQHIDEKYLELATRTFLASQRAYWRPETADLAFTPLPDAGVRRLACAGVSRLAYAGVRSAAGVEVHISILQ